MNGPEEESSAGESGGEEKEGSKRKKVHLLKDSVRMKKTAWGSPKVLGIETQSMHSPERENFERDSVGKKNGEPRGGGSHKCRDKKKQKASR